VLDDGIRKDHIEFLVSEVHVSGVASNAEYLGILTPDGSRIEIEHNHRYAVPWPSHCVPEAGSSAEVEQTKRPRKALNQLHESLKTAPLPPELEFHHEWHDHMLPRWRERGQRRKAATWWAVLPGRAGEPNPVVTTNGRLSGPGSSSLDEPLVWFLMSMMVPS